MEVRPDRYVWLAALEGSRQQPMVREQQRLPAQLMEEGRGGGGSAVCQVERWVQFLKPPISFFRAFIYHHCFSNDIYIHSQIRNGGLLTFSVLLDCFTARRFKFAFRSSREAKVGLVQDWECGVSLLKMMFVRLFCSKSKVNIPVTHS